MDKIDAVIKLVEKEFGIFYFSFDKETAGDRYRILFNKVIGLIETLKNDSEKKSEKKIDCRFAQIKKRLFDINEDNREIYEEVSRLYCLCDEYDKEQWNIEELSK